MFATNPVSKPYAVAQSQQKGVMLADIQKPVHANTCLDRDPMLVAFEGYMLKRLRTSDVCLIENVLHFNINQCAYIIEGSCTEEEKRVTRKRVLKGLHYLHQTQKPTTVLSKGRALLQIRPVFWSRT
jgi:hypothetical protein